MSKLRYAGPWILCLALVVSNVYSQSWMPARGYAGRGSSSTVDVTVDKAGNLYIADVTPCQIRKVTPDGRVTVVAGTGVCGFNGDGGLANTAQINRPEGVVVDSIGNLFIADTMNFRIRKVTPDGIISTVAGTGTRDNIGVGPQGDGAAATSAPLATPNSITVDGIGNLFFSDLVRVCIRKVTPSGIISSVAGTGMPGRGSSGAREAGAPFNRAGAVAVDAAGNIYVADRNRIRKITPSGVATTVAGIGTSELISPGGFSGDGGPATSAQINMPSGLTLDAVGNLYIADTGNNRIRKVTPAGIISTVAGAGTSAFSGDGGRAASASLSRPTSVAVDTAGNLYIADNGNNRVRKVTPAGTISTIALNSSGGARGNKLSAIAQVRN